MYKARLIAAALGSSFAVGTAEAATPADYPSRPIRYVVGGTVGGGADSLARAIGEKLAGEWGQQVIIDNRPGAGGIVASEIVAKSAPGKVKALGVTGARRSTAAPELPTIAESGVPGYEANAWFATFTPAGTPAALVERLNGAIVRSMNAPELRQRLAAQGAEGKTSTPGELGRYTREEMQRWAVVIKQSGARAD